MSSKDDKKKKQQEEKAQQAPPEPKDWNHGICCPCWGICDCCRATFCPCYVFQDIIGEIANTVDPTGLIQKFTEMPAVSGQEQCCAFSVGTFGAGWMVVGTVMRTVIRELTGVEGNPVSDCLTNCFCYPFALLQTLDHLQAINANRPGLPGIANLTG